LPSLREDSYQAPQEFHIDREGEMPVNAVAPTPPIATPLPTPSYQSSFTESTTPEPIKVTRVKTKGTGKKKRTKDRDIS
jgi:hypothetical protein